MLRRWHNNDHNISNFFNEIEIIVSYGNRPNLETNKIEVKVILYIKNLNEKAQAFTLRLSVC
jgi:hypothetical protein